MKVINKDELSVKEAEVLENENKIMSVLNHKNLIKLLDSYEGHNNFYYITDYISGLDLYSFVKKFGPLSEAKAKHLMRVLLKAVSHIH